MTNGNGGGPAGKPDKPTDGELDSFTGTYGAVRVQCVKVQEQVGKISKLSQHKDGYTPVSYTHLYTGGKSQQFHVSFERDQCANCPNKDRCKAKIHKRVSNVTVSIKSHERAKQQRFMESEEFRNLFKIRNGVETLPSLLRRQYHADRMPVRGLIRGRFFFGCKIGALNFKKLFTYRKGLGHYAQNPVLE